MSAGLLEFVRHHGLENINGVSTVWQVFRSNIEKHWTDWPDLDPRVIFTESGFPGIGEEVVAEYYEMMAICKEIEQKWPQVPHHQPVNYVDKYADITPPKPKRAYRRKVVSSK